MTILELCNIYKQSLLCYNLLFLILCYTCCYIFMLLSNFISLVYDLHGYTVSCPCWKVLNYQILIIWLLLVKIVILQPNLQVYIKATGEKSAEMVTDEGAIYVTSNRGYNWRAAVQETVSATLNRWLFDKWLFNRFSLSSCH